MAALIRYSNFRKDDSSGEALCIVRCEMKPCRKCGSNDRFPSGGCKPCDSDRQKVKRIVNAAAIKANRDRWRSENAEKLYIQRKAWFELNRPIKPYEPKLKKTPKPKRERITYEKCDLTIEKLVNMLDYNPDTGILSWKVDHRKYKHGSIAGSSTPQGYLRIAICGKYYCAHRLAFAIIYGYFPLYQIDHINGVTGDNRLCNLRQATPLENGQNLKVFKSNKSGFTGVSWATSNRKWVAFIGYKHKRINLGYFDIAKDAYIAYLEAKKRLHTFNPIPREIANMN